MGGQRWMQALGLFECMHKHTVQPNAVTYCGAINTLAKSQQWERVLVMLDRMKQSGLVLDPATHRAAIRACQAGAEHHASPPMTKSMPQSEESSLSSSPKKMCKLSSSHCDARLVVKKTFFEVI